MGVTISCKDSEISYSLGYGGFLNLRMKIAELCNYKFYEHYKIINNLKTKDDFDDFDEKTLHLIKAGIVSKNIVNFCLAPDSGGEISFEACEEIYLKIKDYDNDINYGYAGSRDCFKFNDFKNLLKECCEHKSQLIWY